MAAKDTLLIFLRGLFMGIADIIPGVSGGTIAFITGIYQRLILSLSELTIFSKLFLRGKWKLAWKKVDFSLFIPLGLGILLAMFLMSGIVTFLLDDYTGITFAFFFGLILASAIYIYTHIKKVTSEHFVLLILGVVVSYILTNLTASQIIPSLTSIFFGGMVAICAMLLPGISGAFILLLLNQYDYLLSAIHELNLLVIIVFGGGAIVGLLAFSKFLHYLLKKFKGLTFAFLIGIMLGSLRIPWEKMVNSSSHTLVLIFFGLVGFVLVLLLGVLFNKKNKRN